MARLLVIAGSDSSAGAGIQADLKTAQFFGVYAQTALTAVTAQNTRGVGAVLALPPALVRGQIEACLGDIGADAIKIGMLGNGAVAAAVADALADTALPLVLDPVLLSTSGAGLLDEAGLAVLKSRLIPRASLVTPNLPEAEALTGLPGPEGARALLRLGAGAVLLKGGHATGAMARDVLVTQDAQRVFESPRRQTRHTHGTGCTLASAIACGLAQGLALGDAVGRAHAYVQAAIGAAPGLGEANGPLNHRP